MDVFHQNVFFYHIRGVLRTRCTALTQNSPQERLLLARRYLHRLRHGDAPRNTEFKALYLCVVVLLVCFLQQFEPIHDDDFLSLQNLKFAVSP